MSDNLISVVINGDSRSGSENEKTEQHVMSNGTRSFDYLWDGVLNKINFFRGHEIEIILYVDKHLDIPMELIQNWNTIENLTVCVSQHRKFFDDNLYFGKWNDMNYLRALYLARGRYIVHFDQDVNAFRSDECRIIPRMKELIDSKTYDYISYPSLHSPDPIFNHNTEWDYFWASTRFFFCKRSTLDFTEIEKCLRNAEYLYGKYGEKNKRCPWLEHVLGIIAGPGKVLYPPMDIDNYAIFSWSKYTKDTLSALNGMSYDEVKRFIINRGGISYPNDLSC